MEVVVHMYCSAGAQHGQHALYGDVVAAGRHVDLCLFCLEDAQRLSVDEDLVWEKGHEFGSVLDDGEGCHKERIKKKGARVGLPFSMFYELNSIDIPDVGV